MIGQRKMIIISSLSGSGVRRYACVSALSQKRLLGCDLTAGESPARLLLTPSGRTRKQNGELCGAAPAALRWPGGAAAPVTPVASSAGVRRVAGHLHSPVP